MQSCILKLEDFDEDFVSSVTTEENKFRRSNRPDFNFNMGATKAVPNSPRRSSKIAGLGLPAIAPTSPRRASIILETETLLSQSRTLSLGRRKSVLDAKSEHLESLLRGSSKDGVKDKPWSGIEPLDESVISVVEYNENTKETRILSPENVRLGNSNSIRLRRRNSSIVQYPKDVKLKVSYTRFFQPRKGEDKACQFKTTYSTYILYHPNTWGPNSNRFSLYGDFMDESESIEKTSSSFPATTYTTYVITRDESNGKKMVSSFTRRFSEEGK
mmetsp:Transcript_5803/g.6641  ORF Transcript_5803/g.6641 Transcript_5803/m.6641 type:complete len:272 (+) Transcript_5803:383-1198(+)